MTNAVYRELARCLLPVVEELVEKAVGPHQFGARKGKLCGQATFSLMDEMDKIKKECRGGYTIYFDVTNAFSSVPIALLLALVDRLGAPDRFCKLLNSILRLSRVVKKGDEREG